MQQSYRLMSAVTGAIVVCLCSPLACAQSQTFLIHGSAKSCSDITQLDSALTSGSQQFFVGWSAKDYDDAFAWSQACASYGWHIPGQPRIPLLQAQRGRSLGTSATAAVTSAGASPNVPVQSVGSAPGAVPAAMTGAAASLPASANITNAGVAPPGGAAALAPSTAAAVTSSASMPAVAAAIQASAAGSAAISTTPATAAAPAAAAALAANGAGPAMSTVPPSGDSLAGAPPPSAMSATAPGAVPDLARPTLKEAVPITTGAGSVPPSDSVTPASAAGAAAAVPTTAAGATPALAVNAAPVGAAAPLAAASAAAGNAAGAGLNGAGIVFPIAKSSDPPPVAGAGAAPIIPAVQNQATPLPAPTPVMLQPLGAGNGSAGGAMAGGAHSAERSNAESEEDSLLTDQFFKQHFHHESVWVANKANLDIGAAGMLSSAQMKNRITADKIVLYCARKANSGESGSNRPLLWDWRWCETEEASAYNRLVAGNEFPGAGRAVLLGCAGVESYVYLERCMQTLTEASGAGVPRLQQ